jgi:hypothetical protein
VLNGLLSFLIILLAMLLNTSLFSHHHIVPLQKTLLLYSFAGVQSDVKLIKYPPPLQWKEVNISSDVTTDNLLESHVMFCNNPLPLKAMTNKHSSCLMIFQRFVKFILPRSPVPYSSMCLKIRTVP